MKAGILTLPVEVTIDFVGTDADIGRLVNRCLAAEALAEARRVQLENARAALTLIARLIDERQRLHSHGLYVGEVEAIIAAVTPPIEVAGRTVTAGREEL